MWSVVRDGCAKSWLLGVVCVWFVVGSVGLVWLGLFGLVGLVWFRVFDVLLFHHSTFLQAPKTAAWCWSVWRAGTCCKSWTCTNRVPCGPSL